MSTEARRRLIRDLKKLKTDPPHGVSAAPSADNIFSWQAIIFGYVARGGLSHICETNQLIVSVLKAQSGKEVVHIYTSTIYILLHCLLMLVHWLHSGSDRTSDQKNNSSPRANTDAVIYRYLQTVDGVHRGVPQQAPHRQIHVAHLPSQW